MILDSELGLGNAAEFEDAVWISTPGTDVRFRINNVVAAEDKTYLDVFVKGISGEHKGKTHKERFFLTTPIVEGGNIIKKGSIWRLESLIRECGFHEPGDDKGRHVIKPFDTDKLKGACFIADLEYYREFLQLKDFREIAVDKDEMPDLSKQKKAPWDEVEESPSFL